MGPLSRKGPALAALAADIAVVPESPRLPSIDDRNLWFGDNRNKGLAVYAGQAFTLAPVDGLPELPRYVVPIQVSGPMSFLLLAVWMQADGADKYVRGLNRAVDLCRSAIAAQPTVVMGDFNANAIWDQGHPADSNHSALVRRLTSLGLVSAYHSYHGEEQGAESHPTFFFRHSVKAPFHIDYCFVPTEWRAGIKDVRVGEFAEWRPFSDHMPLICDVSPQ